VVVIAFDKAPTQALRQVLSNGGFTGAGDSHQDNDHGLLLACFTMRSIISLLVVDQYHRSASESNENEHALILVRTHFLGWN
jgi:hypothetical protein